LYDIAINRGWKPLLVVPIRLYEKEVELADYGEFPGTRTEDMLSRDYEVEKQMPNLEQC